MKVIRVIFAILFFILSINQFVTSCEYQKAEKTLNSLELVGTAKNASKISTGSILMGFVFLVLTFAVLPKGKPGRSKER